MTKTFTLKDLVMYESENKQGLKQIDSDIISPSPSLEIINYVLAYAQALNVMNNKIIGPMCFLLN